MMLASYPTRRPRRLVATASILLLGLFIAGLTSCSQAENPGNIGVFCNLLADGIGLGEGELDQFHFEALQPVAPQEIRPAIERLGAAALQFDEIPDDDLDALFAARFDPEAVTDRSALRSYAESTCGVNLSDGAPENSEQLGEEISSFLQVAAAGRPWLEAIEVLPSTVNAELHSVRVVLLALPEDPAWADEICSNLSGYLYGQENATGNITIDHEGVVLSQRLGPEGQCAGP